MKRINISIIYLIIILAFTSCEDVLDNPPATGLSPDKLTDIESMEGLVYGAYSQARGWGITNLPAFTETMARNMRPFNENYVHFYNHVVNAHMSSALYNTGYAVLSNLNTVAVSNVTEMNATEAQKNAVLGDMHFLRALVYFELNNYYTLPSTGYSVPLITEPVNVDDRVSSAKSSDIQAFVLEEIEKSRQYLTNNDGNVIDYYIATALAARIYFFYKDYEKAYSYANEVIQSGNYILENKAIDVFNDWGNTNEAIFSLPYRDDETKPASGLNEVYRQEANTALRVNTEGDLFSIMHEDETDQRLNDFLTEKLNSEGVLEVYADKKYHTDKMALIYIRLAEMFLIRAEANIRKNNAVSQQDVNDVNATRTRAGLSPLILNDMLDVQTALDILYKERTKEFAYEAGDFLLNIKRLEKSLPKIPSEGSGRKPYSESANVLIFDFPQQEIDIHGLTRTP